MNENHTLQTESPVDGYIRDLIADITNPASQPCWEELAPEDDKSHPGYRLRDADGNIVTLNCDIAGDTHSQYSLCVIDEESNPVMKDVEWKAAGYPSELGTLYAMLRERFHPTKPENVKSASKYASPEQTDCFIQALLRDAQMERPLLSWKREHNDGNAGHYSAKLSEDGNVWLQKNYENEDSDSYTMQYVRDGEMIMSCTETAKLSENPDCLLRELYHLVSKRDPESDDVLVTMPEIHRFVAETETREILERICSTRKETPILVGDLFRQATLHCITHQFVLAAIDKHPGLRSNHLEKLRLQQIAGHMVGALRCAKRQPNGATFTLRATNVAYDSHGVASRTVRTTSSPQRISNAYITWDEVFADADIPHQAKIDRTCVLVLMAMLKDELP